MLPRQPAASAPRYRSSAMITQIYAPLADLVPQTSRTIDPHSLALEEIQSFGPSGTRKANAATRLSPGQTPDSRTTSVPPLDGTAMSVRSPRNLSNPAQLETGWSVLEYELAQQKAQNTRQPGCAGRTRSRQIASIGCRGAQCGGSSDPAGRSRGSPKGPHDPAGA